MEKKVLRYNDWLVENEVITQGLAGAGGDQTHVEKIPGADVPVVTSTEEPVAIKPEGVEDADTADEIKPKAENTEE